MDYKNGGIVCQKKKNNRNESMRWKEKSLIFRQYNCIHSGCKYFKYKNV